MSSLGAHSHRQSHQWIQIFLEDVSLCVTASGVHYRVHSLPATHYLLCHLSVKPNEWVLRREFPIAPTFQPSSSELYYTELDTPCRNAVHDYLKFLNGGENDMRNVNWTLNSCWKLSDLTEWVSFAMVLQCLPVARAVSQGTSQYSPMAFFKQLLILLDFMVYELQSKSQNSNLEYCIIYRRRAPLGRRT
jgi:hypothetical protein